MKVKSLTMSLAVMVAVLLLLTMASSASAQRKNVKREGKVTVSTAPDLQIQTQADVDFERAKPMTLPSPALPPPALMEGGVASERQGIPGFVPGANGDGKTNPVTLPGSSVSRDMSAFQAGDDIIPQASGTSGHPFTTSRVDLVSNNESKSWPYRAAGKLYFNDGAATYVCSASLIKRGVVVTAAHCVAEFGAQRFYSNFTFVPAKSNSLAPYGTWGYSSVAVMTSYFDGTDSCYASGVVCTNDVAVIRLAPQGGSFPGTNTGWFGYGWDGYGFTPDNLTLINQLGYPLTHDSGEMMIRTDSQGYISSSFSGNTVWGSSQTGGSSGGPELVNLGIPPTLYGTDLGSNSAPDIVVGVTSWGYLDRTVKEQGASAFSSSNIVPLVNAACGGGQAACD